MIREATTADIDAILRLGIELHSKAFTRFPVDPVQARRIIAQFVQSPSKFAWVKDVGGEVLGCLLGGTAQVWYSSAKEASDLFFYVKDDQRAVGAGKLLLKRFIRWSYERGADGVSMAVSFGGPRANVTGKIFKKLGFAEVGGVYYLQDKLPEKST